MPTPLNRPIVFSQSGDVRQDCGVTSANAGIAETAFCGYDLPVKQYDITCTFEEGEDTTGMMDAGGGGVDGIGGGGADGDGGDSGVWDDAPPMVDDIPIPIGDEPPSDDGPPIMDDLPIGIIVDNDSIVDDLPIVDDGLPIIIDDIPVIDEPPLPSDGPPPDFGG